MGKWVLYQNNRSFLTLIHLNLLNGVRYDCGELRADTPLSMILKWIVSQDASRPGDVLVFHDQVISVASQGARA